MNYRQGTKMAYVDTLSRNPTVMDNSDRRREEIDILHIKKLDFTRRKTNS